MDNYSKLTAHLREIAILERAGERLGWEQQTYMPAGEEDLHAEQVAMLSSLSHKMFIGAKTAQLLRRAKDSSLSDEQRFVVDKVAHDYERAKRLPTTYVAKWSSLTIKGYGVWKKAKQESKFVLFKPSLQRIFDFIPKLAAKHDPEMTPYESFMYDHDENLKLEQVRQLFDRLKPQIKEIIDKSSRQDLEFLKRTVAPEKQKAYLYALAKDIGYDFSRGRIDDTEHPFSTLGRATVNYHHDWIEVIGSAMHELGHAKYELGLPLDQLGNPLGDYAGLSIHESQSRLWEVHIGKNINFWKGQLPKLKAAYAPVLDDVELQDLERFFKHSQPSFIRIMADDLTYPMHVIMRFELEQDLLSGKLAIKDLPKAWNDKIQTYLGITPPDDAHGCLQDVHWSEGLVGYFPTYVMGSMIAAQLYHAMGRDIPDLEERIASGDFADVNSWLHEKIHKHGNRYDANTLVKMATGQDISEKFYIDYLRQRFN